MCLLACLPVGWHLADACTITFIIPREDARDGGPPEVLRKWLEGWYECIYKYF